MLVREAYDILLSTKSPLQDDDCSQAFESPRLPSHCLLTLVEPGGGWAPPGRAQRMIHYELPGRQVANFLAPLGSKAEQVAVAPDIRNDSLAGAR